jgi:hypothetical protein
MSRSAFEAFKTKHTPQTRETTVTARTGRVFVLRELRGSEQAIADGASDKVDGFNLAYRRIAAGLISIDGDKVPEFSTPKDFDRLLDCIESSELDDLMGAFLNFMPRGEELKKESEEGEPNESPTPSSPALASPKPKR